jgi:hypothetical protein
MDNYQDENWGSKQQRLDVEFAAFNAIKTLLELSRREGFSMNTRKILEIAKEVSPEVFNSSSKLMEYNSDPELVREYRQRANVESKIQKQKIEPIDLLKKDIKENEKYLNYKNEDIDLVLKKLDKLKSIKPLLEEESQSENEWILRDMEVSRALDIDGLPVPPFSDGRCKVFETDTSLLKIRRLHPDMPEHLTGADLIYEKYWKEKKLVRIVHIQYKIWDEQGVLYFSQGNIEQQIDKLKKNVCSRGFCTCKSGPKNSFRFPYCAAFLRPTNKLQNPDKRIVSRGLYVPVCYLDDVLENTSEGNKKLKRESIRNISLNQDTFERLFSENMLGSDWLTYQEVEEFYKNNKILQSDQKLIYHAQDYEI